MKRVVLRLILAFTILPAAKAQNIVLPMAGGKHPAPAPAVTSLSFDPGTVGEGNSTTGTVTLNVAAPSPGGSTVALSSNNSAAQVPSTVTVLAGKTSANFTAATSLVASQQVATVTATLNGTAQFMLTVAIPSVIDLDFGPDPVAGGDPSIGTVTLNVAAQSPGGSTVALGSDNTAVQVPAHVTVLAGNTSANFTATTSLVASQQVVNVTATLNGSAPTTLTVAMPVVTALSFNPDAVAGGYSPTGTVFLNVAAPILGGSTVALSSNNSAVQVPTSVTVFPGNNYADFTATTSVVGSQQVATVTATLNGSAQNTLTVAIPTITGLSFLPDTQWEGSSADGIATLNVAAPSPNGSTVALNSNNAAVQVPATVTVPPGGTMGIFTVETSLVASPQVATVTATLNGAAQGTLTIAPPAVTGLSFNPITVGGGSILTGTVTLDQPAPSPSGSMVALSSDNAAVDVSSVTVPAGFTSTTFTATTTAVTSQQVANVTATLNGTAQGAITVDPASATPHSVTLAWTASTTSNVVGYNIYRSSISYANAVSNPPVFPSTLVTAASACVSTACTFNDNDYGLFDLLLATTYYYVVTAVDANGVESTNSTVVSKQTL